MGCMEGFERAQFLAELANIWELDPGWKRKFLDDPVLRERFQLLERKHLLQLTEGGMTIGAHTSSHPVLSRQTEDSSRKEITESKRETADAVGADVWALAYPYGNPAAVGEREIRFAESAGYSCAFMNVPGDLISAGRFSLPRIHVTASMSQGAFEANISGFHEALRRKVQPSRVSAVVQTTSR
jgi:peptidoglycan/xylan/chitin deacetylase (PgdA/CDA1 family)